MEAVPTPGCGGLSAHHVAAIHRFAQCNPMYHTARQETISGVPVTIYEGDCNRYWLSSVQHSSSRAPFSPTWMLSAYAAVLEAQSIGFREVIDIGSGDGRIAYCAKISGAGAYGVEIDGSLAGLQEAISRSVGVDFGAAHADAASFDYGSLELTRPAFFIGGLAQMGGAALAEAVIERISSVPGLLERSGMVFAGTYSPKYTPDPLDLAGWGSTIRSNGMSVLKVMALPTAWTHGEADGTPYIYARLS